MADSPPSESGVFYGWYVAMVAFCANVMATGTHFYIFNALMDPLCAERAWTRAQINYGLTMGGMVGLAAQLLHGTLVMRIGPRRYMAMGAVASAVIFAFMGRVTEIGWFYVLYIALFLSNGAWCAIVANTVVNNWFVRKKGKALGLANAGISFAGIVLPFAGLILYRSFGLETAFLVISVGILLISPLSLLVVRDRPEDMGLLPDGDTADPAAALEDQANPRAEDQVLWPVAAAVKTGAFWRMGFAYAMTMMGVVGVMSQLAPRLTDTGFSPRAALGLLAASTVVGAIGKYVWGSLCDRHDVRRVVAVMMVCNAAGLAVGLWGRGVALSVVFVLVYGFSMGGVLSTLPIMVAELYGRLSFTSIMRFGALFLVLQNAGFFMMGASHAATHSYDAAYLGFVALNLVAAVLVATISRPAPPS